MPRLTNYFRNTPELFHANERAKTEQLKLLLLEAIARHEPTKEFVCRASDVLSQRVQAHGIYPTLEGTDGVHRPNAEYSDAFKATHIFVHEQRWQTPSVFVGNVRMNATVTHSDDAFDFIKSMPQATCSVQEFGESSIVVTQDCGRKIMEMKKYGQRVRIEASALFVVKCTLSAAKREEMLERGEIKTRTVYGSPYTAYECSI